MASPGMGGGAGPYCAYREFCRSGAVRGTSGLVRNSIVMGVEIQVEDLNAWYGKTQALYDISLKVAANHATALIGPSGCGKSTFIRCLNRLHETVPDTRVTGGVHIGEIDAYNGTSPTQLRRRVGMVFQKANPFPMMSIYDNVASGLKLNGFRDRRKLDEVVHRSLESAALWDEVKDFV